MGHGFIDRFSRMASCIHRLDTRIKIVLALLFIVLVVTTPPRRLLVFVIDAGLLLWITALARLPLRQVLRRAAMVLPFSAFVALGVPFVHGGNTITLLGLHLSVAGLWLLIGATIKSTLAAMALILLMATTPFHAILGGFRALGIPSILVDILSLTHRYLFLFLEEAARLRRAAIARGYAPKWLPQAIIVGRLIGNLFLRSYERAERVYGAMRLRGYNGSLPTSSPASLRFSEGLILVVMILLLGTVRIWVR